MVKASQSWKPAHAVVTDWFDELRSRAPAKK
jgi:hypothetical protein